jgi:hypothetical protein
MVYGRRTQDFLPFKNRFVVASVTALAIKVCSTSLHARSKPYTHRTLEDRPCITRPRERITNTADEPLKQPTLLQVCKHEAAVAV